MESAGEQWGEDEDSLNVYNCPSCGAELLCDKTTAATSCPYCGNPSVIPGKLSGDKKPELIIPFQVDKKAAVAALKSTISTSLCCPRPSKRKTTFRKSKAFMSPSGCLMPKWMAT